MSKFNHILLSISLFLVCTSLYSKEGIDPSPSPILKLEALSVQPILAIQNLTTFSTGEIIDGETIAPQSDNYFRRLRFGFKGKYNKWLKYNMNINLDRFGESDLASTNGNYNKDITVWTAFTSARLTKSDLLYFHSGYYWAAISREYNTSSWGVSSLDKTRSASYLRRFMTGKGNGIESGLGLGGLKNYETFGLSYRTAIHFPKAYQNKYKYTQLYSGRLMLSLGDAEQRKYKFMLNGNQWFKRKGVTIGLGASSQPNALVSDSINTKSSHAFGGDILINYGGFRLDGEYFRMMRSAINYSNYEGYEWHLRTGYNFMVKDKHLEAALSYDMYRGWGNQLLYSKIGEVKTWDVGINYYIKQDKLKLAIHYIFQNENSIENNGDYAALNIQYKL